MDNKGFYQFILCNLTVANIKSRRSFVLFCSSVQTKEIEELFMGHILLFEFLP